MTRISRFASSVIPPMVILGVSLCASFACPGLAHAQTSPPVAALPPRPFGAAPHPPKLGTATPVVASGALIAPPALANNWSDLTNLPGFNAFTMLLLTDGRVLVQDYGGTDWYTLTPDNTGSYINGTWSALGSTPQQCFDTLTQSTETYAPIYFASAVLPDGRVVIIGGEYNFAISQTAQLETNLGEIYDPVANTWTCLSAPSGWNKVGDSSSSVLPNGTFLLADGVGFADATLNLATNPPSWTAFTPPGRPNDNGGYNNEEGWTLLPNGDVLTLEIWNSADTTITPADEFSPSTLSWTSVGAAPNALVLISSGNTQYFEIGPAVLRPDGTVFATGATGPTAIYNTNTSAWTAGPTLPTIMENVSCNGVNYGTLMEQFALADAPAALLPNGNVLIDASPVDANCGYLLGTEFFEFDGTNLTQVAGSFFASSDASYYGKMLTLPTGQILFTDSSGFPQIYTESSGGPNAAWAPTITSSPAEVGAGGTNFKITGTQFNGLSQAGAYGDDFQDATNYPLVRITNLGTGDVFYARTHGHSSMAVATGSATVSTLFDVPAGIELGASTLVIVTNGIPSTSVPINVLKPGNTALVSSQNPSTSGQLVTFTATVSGSGGTPTGMVTFYDGATSLATTLGSGTLNGSGVTTFATSSLAIGSHTITAQYSGDATFGSTTSTAVTQVVNGKANTTGLVSSLNPSLINKSVTFTATVTPTAGGGTPTGTVTFLDANSSLDGNTVLGTVTLSGGNAPPLSTPLQFLGTHSVTAQYSGDTIFSSSTSTAVLQVVNNPMPAITTLSPSSATAGGAAFTLTVNGTNFVPTSVVNFNGIAESTSFVSSTRVLAMINVADIATGGTFPVTVTNPPPGGGTSTAVNFTVNNLVPTITTLSPLSATAGGAAFTLTVNGTNFVTTSVVNFNGNARTTTFVSATQVTAAILATDIATVGTFPVTVMNPPPGGGTSTAVNFQVVSAATLTSIAVTPTAPSIAKGQTQQFTATGHYSDGTTQDVTTTATWASGTGTVGTIGVTTGLATGVGVGTTNITAVQGGVTSNTAVLTVTAAVLTSIAVTPTAPSIAKGQTQQFTATGHYSDGTTQDVTTTATWASGTGTVGTIGTSTGLATGVGVGTTNITAAQGGVKSNTAVLTVTAAVLVSIAVTPANPSVAAGKTQQFTATGTFSDSTTQNLTSSVVWASGTTTVATISAGGLATTLKAGSSTISATSGSVVGTTTLTVTAAVLVSIAVTPANPSVAAGNKQQFTATGTFSDSTTQNLTSSVVWASGTTTVATISGGGLATTLKAGSSTISATSGSVVGTTTLTVTAAVLVSIAVTPANPSVAAGKTQQFTATGTFSDSTTQNLTSSVVWASGTTTVATISGGGLATTLKVGSSTISATSGSVVGTTTLTVTAAVLVSIAVTPANPSVAAGKTQQFTATGTFSDSTTQNLTSSVVWASGTTTVATIAAGGLATTLKVGSSTISATSGSVVGTTTLTVTAAALVSIAVTPANPSVAAGNKQQFTATGTFSDSTTQNLTGSVTWASGTTTVATISAGGLATAVNAGSSTISATSGSVVGTTTLTVIAAVLVSIAVTPANPSVAAGNKQQFTATGTFSDSTTQNLTSSVTWASGTTTVATIAAGGLATTLKAGSSTISATSGSVVGTTTLTVTAAVLVSIAVTPANPSILLANTQQFTATGTFSDSSTQDLTSSAVWASGTTTVATITAGGLATALKAGTSTISATSGSVMGSTTLTVNALPVITTNLINQTVNNGASASFTAAASGSPVPTVQWQVSVGGGAFSNVANATSTTLTFTTTFSQNGNKYQAVFTNSVGTATTTAATLKVVAPDLTVAKSHAGNFTVGQSGTYTIKVTNNGTGPTTGTITVTDTLNANLTFVPAGSGGGVWVCTVTGQVVTCTSAGPIAAAANSSFPLVVMVAPGAYPSVPNTASVADPNDGNPTGADKTSAADTATVNNALPVAQSVSPTGAVLGQPATITITGSGFNSSTKVSLNGTPITGAVTASADGKTLTITIPAAQLETAGPVNISVTNPPGGGGTSANIQFTIVDFTLAQVTSGTVQVTAGTPSNVALNLTTTPAGAALPDDVNYTCAVPASLSGTTCAINPTKTPTGTLGGSAAANSTLMITTTASLPPAPRRQDPWALYLLWLTAAALAGLMAMYFASQQKLLAWRVRPAYLALALLTISMAALAGCTTTHVVVPTPKGAATVTVTATSGGDSKTTTININVN